LGFIRELCLLELENIEYNNFYKAFLLIFFMKTRFEIIILLIIFVLGIIFFSGFELTGFVAKEFSPHNIIEEKNILVYEDSVVINLSNYVVSRYNSTKSMVPVIDSNANGIGIRPNSSEDIFVGDIISFYHGEKLIVHRVIEKGEDEFGDYFITKGDNVNFDDGKIRFEEIDSILAILIY
jgi:hypothetical protein